MFNIGDYARHITTGRIVKITSLSNDTINGYPVSCYIPWQPQIGEWCWFWIDGGEPCIGQYILHVYDTYKYTTKVFKMDSNKNKLAYYCEPFIGKLPSWIVQ